MKYHNILWKEEYIISYNMHNKITFPNTVRSKRGEILYNNCTAALRIYDIYYLHVLVLIYNIKNIYNYTQYIF